MRTLRLFSFAFLLIAAKAGAQNMTFGFIRNCMSFQRTTVTDELKKIHFHLLDREVKTASNPVMTGAAYYSTQADGDITSGEIRVLSKITSDDKITEITFMSGDKKQYNNHFNDLYQQMVNFFKDERAFKSKRYGDVTYFQRDKTYYYVFKQNGVPMIVVADRKLEKDYFN